MYTSVLFAIWLAIVPATRSVTVPDAEQYELTRADGEVYRVSVARSLAPATSGGYGVLIVLDANAMFLTAVEASRFGQGFVPHLIVGIGYPTDTTTDQQRRYYDFTPPTSLDVIRQSGSSARMIPKRTGGEDKLLEFIEHQLKPDLEARYPIDRNNYAIFGHSLAGRFVLHTLFTRPDAFRVYAAASPSIWWNERSILKEVEAFMRDARAINPPRSLLMTVAEYDQRAGPAVTPERAEFLAFARMVDAARELADKLKHVDMANLRVSFTEFKDENHGSVVPPSIARAVAAAFRLPPSTAPATAPSR